MNCYKLKVAYKGTNYFGWQDLGANESKPTVQATIHSVLKKICKYQACTIAAASRTDAGVHAQGQVVKVTIPREIETGKLLRGMNSLLPDDIRIVNSENCTQEFNPNKDVKSKQYHYYFSPEPISNPVLDDFVAHVTPVKDASTTGHLNLDTMHQACELFIGEHDFYSFATRDASVATTVRVLLSCMIVKADFSPFVDEVYYVKITGGGFLRHMIRYIVGALFDVGRGKISLPQISAALRSPMEDKLSPKAKARGLHLIHVSYEET